MPAKVKVTSGTLDVLDRLLKSGGGGLPPGAARFFLALEFSPPDRDRMNELAAKARAGRLNPAENREIEEYIQVGHLVNVLKSRSRRAIEKAVSAR